MNSKYFTPKANQEFFENFLASPRQVKLYRIRFDYIFNEQMHKKQEITPLEPISQYHFTDILRDQVEKRKKNYEKKMNLTQLSPLRNTTFQISPSPRVRNLQRYISRGKRSRFTSVTGDRKV